MNIFTIRNEDDMVITPTGIEMMNTLIPWQL
jgi:hypothetical protein